MKPLLDKCTKDTNEDDASWIILIKVLQILGMVWGSQTHGDKKLREYMCSLCKEMNLKNPCSFSIVSVI